MDFGRDSTAVKIVNPVVVKPEMLSKKAFVMTEMIDPFMKKMYGIKPINENIRKVIVVSIKAFHTSRLLLLKVLSRAIPIKTAIENIKKNGVGDSLYMNATIIGNIVKTENISRKSPRYEKTVFKIINL